MEQNQAILDARAKLRAKFGGDEGAKIGGKGTQRRKVKAKHSQSIPDDKKTQAQLKRLGVNPIPGINEVNMFKDDQTVIHFENPKVQASIGANTYVISGNAETKPLSALGPQILNQMGNFSQENMLKLQKLAEQLQKSGKMPGLEGGGDDEIPDIPENFEDVSKGGDDAQDVD